MEVSTIAENSRADYFKERRKSRKSFSVLLEREKAERFEKKLDEMGKTKSEWLNDKIEEELEMDFDLEWEVKCPYCGEEVNIDLKDYVVDESGYEREMGAETEYTIECDGLNCTNCNKHFGIRGSIWEYPEGAYNSDSIEAIKEDEDNDEDSEDGDF